LKGDQNNMGDKMRELLTAKRRRGWYLALTLVLAVLVTAGVGGLFHQPAVAKTYQVTALTCTAEAPVGPGYAGFFVHTHNEDCFDENETLVCPLPEIKAHVHDETCYTTTSVQTCGLAESDGHQHSEACYTRVRGDLICGKSTEPVLDEAGNVLEEGHVHTDECFAWTEELTCGLEAGEGAHHHNESCFEYVTNLTCDKPEVILHAHSDDCYQKNEDGSIYVDEDGNTFLICGMTEVTEHVHGPECFTTYELDDEEAGNTENTEGDESGLIFLFPEEEEEEEQPAESANPETETGDTDVTDDGNADPADGNTPDTDETVDTEETENTELADGVEPNAEGEKQEAASGETAPIAEEPHEVIYTGTRGAEKSGVTVLAEIPEGALDENAQLVLADADESAARKQILQVVNENSAEGEEREISSMLLLDIGFVSGGEPAVLNGLDPVRVTIKATSIRTMSAPKLFHLIAGTAQEVKDVLFDAEAGTAVFTGITFSPFAVVDLTGEDPAEEAAEETIGVSMPAQSFTGETDGVIVSVEAPEGAFPEGTTMVVSQVEMDDDTLSNVTDAVESSGEKKVVTAQAVDISFFDAEGTLIEPKLPIRVSMKSALVSESENVALVHLTETAAAEPAENAEAETTEAPAAPTAEVVTDVQVVENSDEHNEIQFESDAFSVYVLVGTETITTNFITADGETYTITVTYGPEAGIPAGATLAVAEIPQGSEEYAAYLAQAQNAVKAGAAAGEAEAAAEPAEATEDAVETPAEAEAAEEAPEGSDSSAEAENTSSTGGTTDRITVTTARFFDITILDAEGNPVEPAAPVNVKIAYMEPAETAENYQVVHFGAETEVLNPAVSGADGTASAFDFQTDSFSVFGVVGTKTLTVEYTLTTPDGDDVTYVVTVTYDDSAKIPEGTVLVVNEVPSGTNNYNEVREAVIKEDYLASTESEEIEEIEGVPANLSNDNVEIIADAIHFQAFEISLIDKNGNEIEPESPVQVSITLKYASSEEESQKINDTLMVHHINEKETISSVEKIADAANGDLGEIEVSEDQVNVEFSAESFSTYTISWNSSRGTITINFNYVDENGNPLDGMTGRASITHTTGDRNYAIPEYAPDIEGYTFTGAYYNSTAFTQLRLTANTTWYYNNGWVSGGSAVNRVFFINGSIPAATESVPLSQNKTFNVNFVYREKVPTKVHYGYIENGEFVEWTEEMIADIGTPTILGDQMNIRREFSGKDYVTTRINDPISGNQISPLLQTEKTSYSYWRYRILDTLDVNDGINEWQAFGTNENDIYVIYRDTPTEKSYDDGGLTADDLAAPATNKDVKTNNDGTYDVSLSVTGTSNSKHNKTHANVVIVLDTSSSMSGTDTGVTGQTRLQAAQNVIRQIGWLE